MKNISEIYYTLQGEGIFIGTPSVIIRFAGCNLSCKWCDTPTKIPNEDIHISTIRDILVHNKCNHIIFTGGEPTLHQDEILEIIANLKKAVPYSVFYTIETNSTIKLQPRLVNCRLPILYSLSPKLTSSENRYNLPNLIRQITELTDVHAEIQVKLCIDLDCKEDLEDTKTILYMLKDRTQNAHPKPVVILQPVTTLCDPSHYLNLYEYSISLQRLYNWVTELSIDLPIRVLPQLHKIIWGFNTEGT